MKDEVTVAGWRVSLSSADKPETIFGDAAGNARLSNVELGSALHLKPKDWVLFHAKCRTPANIVEKGGSVHFAGMTGKAEIHLNGKLVMEKKASGTDDVVFPVEPGVTELEFNVLMQPDSKGRALLADAVYLSPVRLKAAGSKP